jgi:hypothetical protein
MEPTYQIRPARLAEPLRTSPFRAGGAPSMRQHERKSRILLEWDRWLQAQPVARRRPTARDTLKFFYELEDSGSPLLDFRSGRRDKWQMIHAWLLEFGRVSEAVPPTRSPALREQGTLQPRIVRKKKAQQAPDLSGASERMRADRPGAIEKAAVQQQSAGSVDSEGNLGEKFGSMTQGEIGKTPQFCGDATVRRAP